MIFSALIKHFREKVDDVRQPYLWSDNMVKDMINAAYWEASERTNYFRERAKVTLVADQAIYTKASFKTLDDITLGNREIYDYNEFMIDKGQMCPITRNLRVKYDSSKGKPSYYDLDYVDEIGFYSVPNKEYEVQFDVLYYPEKMEGDNDNCLLPYTSQLPMLYWAMKLAFEKYDSDTEDIKRAQYNEGEFVKEFGMRTSLGARVKQRRHRIWGVDVPIK